MEHFSTQEVMETVTQIMEHASEVELKLQADHISVKGLLAYFWEQIYIAKMNGCYMLMIEADSLSFEKVFSPIKFLNPDELEKVIERVAGKD